MEVVPYHEESGAWRGTEESLLPEIGSGFVSEDEEDRRYVEKEHRYSVSVFLENLEGDAADDVPEMPPLFVVKFPELVEKAWGWQRLLPYIPGGADWRSYKVYLEEYARQNDGEVAALCANNKPDKDRNYFAHAARCANMRPGLDAHTVASDCNAVCADSAARLCIDVEHEFRWSNYLPIEEVDLSNEIEDFANRMIKSASEYSPTAVAGLVCIAKETELLVELVDVSRFKTTDLIDLSKKVRRSVFNLILRAEPESSAAIGAMVGLAKEAKFLRYLLSREDPYIERELDLCGMIRTYTEKVFTMLLEEFACKTPSNGVGNNTPASVKSEKHIGVSTNGYLNCKESGSLQDFKAGLKECCGKDNIGKSYSTTNKDVELQRKASADISANGSNGQLDEVAKEQMIMMY
ncbi:hypothetical protein EJB05_36460 [Eragrostis curvula]|uniref:Uncharacterized protein n=1 Tax=Eragrostis curvula TaxID=38414 RepID=A0A5J9UA88_9POAL|nr:hypothetical protein EJB05_36460 [Eragrostis curvula]